MWKKTKVFSKSSPLLKTLLLVLRCLAYARQKVNHGRLWTTLKNTSHDTHKNSTILVSKKWTTHFAVVHFLPGVVAAARFCLSSSSLPFQHLLPFSSCFDLNHESKTKNICIFRLCRACIIHFTLGISLLGPTQKDFVDHNATKNDDRDYNQCCPQQRCCLLRIAA
jgi:hypothetical protein